MDSGGKSNIFCYQNRGKGGFWGGKHIFFSKRGKLNSGGNVTYFGFWGKKAGGGGGMAEKVGLT